MGLFERLFASEEQILREEILAGLSDDYNSELRLAQQLREHAAEAPYPQAAERLRKLAAIEEAQAERLRVEIVRLGGIVSPPELSTLTGRNHWARLVHDLDEERTAGKRYLEQAIRWENDHPELAELLRTFEREEQQHRLWLQDMIARSDPQAIN